MVSHEVLVRGVNLRGALNPLPVLLQMNDDDFPARFLHDLGSPDQLRLSSTTALTGTAVAPVVLLQPVQRVLHLVMLQLSCSSVGEPRLDPMRIESAGVVIRRVPRQDGKDKPNALPWAWMKSPKGEARWIKIEAGHEDNDPEPAKRPRLQSGQAELDRLLMTQALATAKSESFSPAFAAAPAICDRLNRTVVYAVIPTASSETSDVKPSAPVYDNKTFLDGLPPLLLAGSHSAPKAGEAVDYRFMSDEYAANNNARGFQKFSLALRLLYSAFGAFESTPAAQKVIGVLNKHRVTFGTGVQKSTMGMGTFYRQAASKLIDFDPNSQPPQPVPSLQMPDAWDSFSDQDQAEIENALKKSAQAQSGKILTPEGRYQDPTRLYKLRMFLRVKGHSPDCPPQLLWSEYSQPFRIAAWYEGGRPLPPVPLPDPTDKNFLKKTRPNAAFAVPAGLMNAIQSNKMSDLTSGSGNKGGPSLNWICGFNIPLITICAFFVLNIFLQLLNIVFFWLPFIKICIPFPMPAASSGEE